MSTIDSYDQSLAQLANVLGVSLKRNRWTVATAESCTGGWVATAITSVAGSSAWFDRGFVTYSNAAKSEMLRVAQETLQSYGAVSEPTAREMVEGALSASHADVALAITGIAGPGGGLPDRPVGTVWFAFAFASTRIITRCQHFSGDRLAVRYQAVAYALENMVTLLTTASL